MNNKILKYLDSFRKIKANSDFKISLLRVNILFLIGIFILIIIESLFYLQPQNRYTAISYILFIASCILNIIFNVLYMTMIYYMLYVTSYILYLMSYISIKYLSTICGTFS